MYRLQSEPRPQIIDVRSPTEFAAGHVPGAVNIPMEQMESRLADLHATAVVLVCQSGTRAAMVAERLAADRTGLQVLAGGTNAWTNNGLCTVASVRTRWSLERQVRLGAGLLVLAGVGLSLAVDPAWIYLSAFIGAGLTFAGFTNRCGMAALLAKMPWNRPRGKSV